MGQPPPRLKTSIALSFLLLLLSLLPITISEPVDGITACKSCTGTNKCVGRTVSDELCSSCSSGQSFWPCNLVKECWCWDSTLPYRDPGDDDATGACAGCTGETEVCVGNQNSLIPVDDETCSACANGQSFWPCDTDGLCWCWDTTQPKKPPAPSSGLAMESGAEVPCDSYFTEAVFWDMAPNSTFPYTYEGFCKAVEDYNLYHDEKVFMMGSLEQRKAELAAFLGNTAHESDDFEAGREYLACGDRKEVDGKVYCKPCNNDLYDWVNNICSVSMVDQNSPYNSYCQPSFEPPEGCVCDTITQVAETGELAGYVEASKVFYGRGAIQLSWNYNYIRASYALTGAPETFCQNPELVAQNELYAWGSGIFFWMESEKEGTTCHKEALKGDFGGTLNVINGGLECPAYHGGWHAAAVKMRINRYCHAARLLGLDRISTFSGCRGLFESFDECLHDGTCPYCEEFPYPGNNTLFENHDGEDGASEEHVPEDSGAEETTPTTTGEDEDSSGNDETDSETISEVVIAEDKPEAQNIANPTMMPVSAEIQPINTLEPTTIAKGSIQPSSSPSMSTNTLQPSLNFTDVPISNSPTSLAPVASVGETSSPPTVSPAAQAVPETTPPTAFTIVMAKPSITDEPTSSPSSKPITEAPQSNSPSSKPLTEAPYSDSPTENPTPSGSTSPTYSPSSPQPTMGPCDGDPCPNDWCRSTYGFCGEGSSYCTNTAIWSPSCRANTSPPTSAPWGEGPTHPPNDFGYGGFDGSGSNLPTVSPSSAVTSGFVKPNPGKKPPQGKKPTSEASSSTESNGKYSTNDSESATDPPTDTSTNIPEPTPHPTNKVYSPTDPESSYYCGKSWADANKVCAIMCPSAKSEDCPPGESCYAFTDCNKTKEPTESPVVPFKYGEPNGVAVIEIIEEPPSEELVGESKAPVSGGAPTNQPTVGMEGCTGQPCPFAGECRSQYGFCGSSFIYCNTLSSWTMKTCGLFGKDADGKTILCDADTNKCPDGKHVVRNPTNNCEFFECPVEEESNFVFGGSTPAKKPTLPPIPKPTLSVISNPKKPEENIEESDADEEQKPIIGSQNNIIIPIGNKDKPAKGSQTIVIGNEKDGFEDDTDKSPESESGADTDKGTSNSNAGPESSLPKQTGFSTDFSPEEWLASGKISRICGISWLSVTVISFSMLLFALDLDI